jgi:pimeloyl-ACP methyl ester carboxylesterase
VLIFIQSGIPGVTPYASGPHIWETVIQRFPKAKALEVEGDTVDAMLESLEPQIPDGSHLIGHDLGGLLALRLACEAHGRVRSVSAVSSVAAAPTGDGVPNLTLAYPPMPLWSRASQRWALERVSYSHHHVDQPLLDACVAASERLRPVTEDFLPSLTAAKSTFYEVCRGGFPVPAQVIWGTHDPLGTFEQGLWLFRLIAARQKAAHFHAVNRAGSLLFREEPEAFHQMVSAFVESV